MATNLSEIALVDPKGVFAESPAKGSYVQNMVWREGAWRTRPGFGQIAQLDTTLAAIRNNAAVFGYETILGSAAMRSDLTGNIQILTAVRARVYTGNEAAIGVWRLLDVLVIYDVTTRERWEEPLINHTSGNAEQIYPMPFWRGVYETARNQDLQSYPRSGDAPYFFEEASDTMFFGSEQVGLYAYTPADFRGARRRQVDSVDNSNWNPPYSETSLIVQVAPAPGLLSDNFAYLDNSNFPRPVSVATFLGRLAMASGREVYFSDPGQPQSIVARNFISIPSQENLVAIKEVGDNLVCFTASETWAYQPNVSNDGLINAGRVSRMRDDVGCLGHSVVVKAGSRLAWMDRNGVYATEGLLDLTEVSQAIRPFFDSNLSNPLTSYYARLGNTDLSVAQPRIFYSARLASASAAFHPPDSLVLFLIPEEGIVLTWNVESAAWAVWSLESIATTDATEVQLQAGLINNRVVAIANRLFLVGGMESKTIIDSSVTGGVGAPVGRSTITNSLYITEYDHGGALDRSVHAREDNRQFSGDYSRYFPVGTLDAGSFYLDEPIRLPANYVLPRQGGVGRNDIFLFPLAYAPSTTPTNFNRIILRFNFDSTNWLPVTAAGTVGEIDVLFPPERGGSASGWGLSGMAADMREARLYDVPGAGGVPANVGRNVRLYFSASTAPITWSFTTMNLARLEKQVLMWIPFVRIDPDTEVTNMGFELEGLFPLVRSVAGAAYLGDIFVWNQTETQSVHSLDDTEQPVDWVYKTPQVGLKSGQQSRARTLYVTLRSHGVAITRAYPDTLYGPFNAILASDWKDWASQIIDYEGDISRVPNVDTVRTRLRNSAATPVLVDRVFVAENNTAGARWGAASNDAVGNLLADDPALDTISISTSVRGEHFSWMLFGLMRNRAEQIVLDQAQASFIPTGGRRRRGR